MSVCIRSGVAQLRETAVIITLRRREASVTQSVPQQPTGDRLASGSAITQSLTSRQSFSLLDMPGRLRSALPDLSLTLDPVEYRGFEYQTGVSFTVFAEGVRGELARGGRYVTEAGESATGVSLYMDSILRALPEAEPDIRLYLPSGTTFSQGKALREDGWATVSGLQYVTDIEIEARRLECSHYLVDDTPVAVSDLGN